MHVVDVGIIFSHVPIKSVRLPKQPSFVIILTADYIKDRFLIERKSGFRKGIVDFNSLPICHIYNDWKQEIQTEEAGVGMLNDDLKNLRDDATNYSRS